MYATKVDVIAAIVEMVTAIKARPNTNTAAPEELLKKHPWMNSYISIGRTEAEKLFYLGQQGEFEVSESTVTRAFPNKLIVRVSVPKSSDSQSFSFLFTKNDAEGFKKS